MRSTRSFLALALPSAALALALVLPGCNTGPKAQPEPEPVKTSPAPAAAAEGALHLGAPIDDKAVQKVSLAEVAKNPGAFMGKTFATTGTVTSVCQHRGCWMEIKDDASEAHIKMAGHAFFVPKTASGKKARVLATLVKNYEDEGSCNDEGMAAAGEKGGAAHGGGCKAEAEAQLGRPLAKLELVADGVELM
ncbi:MAG: hypothetical protein JWP97_4330 [Labilithrix sp.]|nr:hypothetical protein [Labilithrix sp.]